MTIILSLFSTFLYSCGKLSSDSFSSAALTLYYLFPVCKNIGTASEGWYVNDTLISELPCQTKVLSCEQAGTSSEGWYVYDQVSSATLLFSTTTSCKETKSMFYCSNTAAPAGWLRDSSYISPPANSCAVDIVSCYESTGSYSLKANNVTNKSLLTLTKCSSLATVSK